MDLAWASARNALRQLVSARRLRDLGDLPTAFYLVVQATEEMGKAVLCAETLREDRRSSEWTGFWRAYRSHREKIRRVLRWELLGAQVDGWRTDLREWLDFEHLYQEVKKAAAYTEFSAGRIRDPSTHFTAELLEAALAVAERRYLVLVQGLDRFFSSPGSRSRAGLLAAVQQAHAAVCRDRGEHLEQLGLLRTEVLRIAGLLRDRSSEGVPS